VVTVNAVFIPSLLSSRFTIKGNSNRSHCSPGIAQQTTPVVLRIIHAIFSGVDAVAAKIKSPSFSRFSLSSTKTNFPAANIF